MRVAIVNGASSERFEKMIGTLAEYAKANPRHFVFIGAEYFGEYSVEIEVYDDLSDKTLKGAEALAAIIRDRIDKDD